MEGGLILFVAALVLLASPAVSMPNNPPVNVTRTGCGTSKLCRETPKGCNPTGAGPCLFVSVVSSAPVEPRGTNLSIQLQGESTGYIALGLSVPSVEATTLLFVCGQDNKTFFFKTVTRNNTNNALIENSRATLNSRGSVNGNRIACEFGILDVNATTIAGIRSSISTRSNPASSFALLLGTGMVTDNALGTFNVTLNTGVLNLTDPTPAPTPTPTPSNSTTHSTTAANSTTHSAAHSAAGQPHAALLLPLGVLSLSALLSGRS